MLGDLNLAKVVKSIETIETNRFNEPTIETICFKTTICEWNSSANKLILPFVNTLFFGTAISRSWGWSNFLIHDYAGS